MSRSMPTDVRTALRRATAHLHEKVDAAVPLAGPSPSLRDYREHLQLLAPWVQDLAGLGVARSRLDAEARAIEADLQACQRLLGPQEAARPSALHSASVARSGDAAFGLGARYVLEGSRLGAAFLHRRLADALAPHPLAYLSGAGWMPEGTWRGFLALLERQVGTAEQIARACEGANAAFLLLLGRCEAQAAAA